MADLPRILRLKCQVQQYSWGVVGESSCVAQLARAGSGLEIHQDQPYAELWMGTHCNAPSVVIDDHGNKIADLKSYVKEHSEMYLKKGQDDLPFLFKVLSIGKALSIQAHPDKKLARELRLRDPKNYPDDNHKPEMALALECAEALVGFRPLDEIAFFLKEIEPLQRVIGVDISHALIDAVAKSSKDLYLKVLLRQVFTSLMTCSPAIISEELKNLLSMPTGHLPSKSETAIQLVRRLHVQYPGDVGNFCVFLLNYVHLEEGDAIFLGANEPHAYISGHMIECMATSDNVVRAGLTPKFKDVQVLCDMLTYRYGPAQERIMRGEALSDNISCYTPPINEFRLRRIQLRSESIKLPSVTGPSILLVIKGCGSLANKSTFTAGQVFFLAPETTILLIPEEEGLLFQAYCD